MPNTPASVAHTVVHAELKAPKPRKSGSNQRRPNLDDEIDVLESAAQSLMDRLNYQIRVRDLSSAFPKLRVISPAQCRHEQAGKITTFDGWRENLVYEWLHRQDIKSTKDAHSFGKMLRLASSSNSFDSYIPKKSKTSGYSQPLLRLILVEDLSLETIAALGATFQINPEFFADHLHRAGFGTSQEETQPLSEWASLPTKKLHFSFEWYRIVMPSLTIKKSFRDQLLEEKRPRGPCPHPECKKEHEWSTSSNVWRWPWKLSPIPTSRDSLDHEMWPIGWSEKITIWMRDDHVIVLFDPLPLLKAYKPLLEQDGNEVMKRQGKLTSRRRVTFSNSAEALAQRLPIDGQAHTGARHADARLVPFRQLSSRGLPTLSDAALLPTSVRIEDLVAHIRFPKSTLEECLIASETGTSPLVFILEAIHDDIEDLTRVIRKSLDTIRVFRADAQLVQEDVWYWREILNQYEDNLAKMSQGIENFETFFKNWEDQFGLGDLFNLTKRCLEETSNAVSLTQDQLRVELQIVDSRRSIAEAESVSKLTELAFVFIPLSFAASLFSMQIKELGDGVPAYLFVVVAISLIIAAYCVRLALRNTSIVRFRQYCFQYARAKGGLTSDQPVPTRVMVRSASVWIFSIRITKAGVAQAFKRVGIPILAVAIIAGFLSPIIVLWRRQVNNSLSAVITVLVVVVDVIALWPVAQVAMDWERFREHLQSIRHPTTKKRTPWNRRQSQNIPSKAPDEEGVFGEPVPRRAASGPPLRDSVPERTQSDGRAPQFEMDIKSRHNREPAHVRPMSQSLHSWSSSRAQ